MSDRTSRVATGNGQKLLSRASRDLSTCENNQQRHQAAGSKIDHREMGISSEFSKKASQKWNEKRVVGRALPRSGKLAAGKSLASSIREMYRNATDEPLTPSTFSDNMSDNVKEKEQKKEMRKASACQSGTILPRYYSDPSLCKCSDKTPWTREPCDARNRDDLSSECWPNTNPERPEEETNSTRPETENIAVGRRPVRNS